MLLVTPVQNVSIHRVQNVEGGWWSSLEGLMVEDLKVQLGTKGWKTSWWTKALPRVKWVPTFTSRFNAKNWDMSMTWQDELTVDTKRKCEDRKSTSGCLGSGVISWLSRKRLSTLQHVQPVTKQCGFTNYWQDCLLWQPELHQTNREPCVL